MFNILSFNWTIIVSTQMNTYNFHAKQWSLYQVSRIYYIYIYLGKIGKIIISLEPKMFCLLNGIHSHHKNYWYKNLGSITRKLVQVAQRNCPKCLLESFKGSFIWSYQIVSEFSLLIIHWWAIIWRMIWT